MGPRPAVSTRCRTFGDTFDGHCNAYKYSESIGPLDGPRVADGGRMHFFHRVPSWALTTLAASMLVGCVDAPPSDSEEASVAEASQRMLTGAALLLPAPPLAPADAAEAMSRLDQDPSVIRYRFAAWDPAALTGQSLQVELFDGEVASFTASHVDGQGPDTIWMARDFTHPLPHSASLLGGDGVLVGHIHHAGSVYRLQLVSPQVVALIETAQEPETHANEEPPPPFDDPPPPPPPEQPDGVIDLMVFYTSDARAQAEPLSGHFSLSPPLITYEIRLAVADVNLALDDSLMATDIRLVDIAQSSLTEDPTDPWRVSAQLGVDIVDPSSITAMRRKAVLADLVSVWVSSMDPGQCGVGSYPRVNRPERGRSIVKRSCVPNHTLTHEIGHNLGAKHDPAAYSSSPSGSSYAFISRGPLAWDGTPLWEDRDVMASTTTCAGFCPRWPMFSNPLVNHKLMPFGTFTTHNAAGFIDTTGGPIVDDYSLRLP